MQRVVHTLGRSIGGGGGRRFGGGLGVLGCFVDVNESLAGCINGSVGSLCNGGTHDGRRNITKRGRSLK